MAQPRPLRLVPPSPQFREMPPRIPPPSHRHASPSGPWPWMDLDSALDPSELTTPQASDGSSDYTHTDEECDGRWAEYPQSLFPNWTPEQVGRSGIKRIYAGSDVCVIHHVDVGDDGKFHGTLRHTISEKNQEEFWKFMHKKRPDNNRLRALFLENLSLPVLQMLGTKYNVEPFFWSSSLNWIPSRYREELQPAQGDHITITLPFIRSMSVPVTVPRSPAIAKVDHVIDTQLPLFLSSDDPSHKNDQMLLLDLLAVHMVRSPEGSTIISYHPTAERYTTSAKDLHVRVRLAGQSVYWQNIFHMSNDPTFVLLTILWYAIYAWDEALETLWDHICQLELSVISTNNMLFTHELHKIRAHLLHYITLLDDFRKSVDFVLNTPNPVMESPPNDDLQREISKELLKKECYNLLTESKRLAVSMEMQDKRLSNVMNLAFSYVNLNDSGHMRRLTEAALRDSAAMKQISYVTMIFLPASFAAGVFGMNIKEINPGSLGTLAHYVATAIPLTLITVWIVVAAHGKRRLEDDDQEVRILDRLSWPVRALGRLNGRRKILRRRPNVGRWAHVNDAI